jgi:hypothetical protein
MIRNIRDRALRIIRSVEDAGYQVIFAIDPSLPQDIRIQKEAEAKVLLDEARANGERVYSIPHACTIGYYRNEYGKVAQNAG